MADYETVDDVFKRVDERNRYSESNGCLMRITPLAVWCRNLPRDELFEAVKL
jgi:ADP-ribosylglycohydrolase